ncbi:MAG: hypothetical protein A2512_01010 [Deltaproteobacteria bacterium RIFOXYD12_FULL_56_24]|nr:MAG: hypothetical protein A2512_01010 [Deltaproteobacteria bacterium RIFOXYD12_FULL_56_24]
MATAGAFAFTTTHWMINRIHGNATDLGTVPFPATAPSLAKLLAFMFVISNLANTGTAFPMKLANLARG